MLNVFYDSYRILMRVYGQGTFLKQAINAETIEPLNKNTVIKIVYGTLDNDIYLDYVISLFSAKRPKLPVRVILKIALYNVLFLNKASYAVTDNAVELLKKLGKGGASGFVNALLRKIAATKGDIPLPDSNKDKLLYYSVKYSYPVFAVSELINDYGDEKAELIAGYDVPHNYVRFDKSVSGEDFLENAGKSYEHTPFPDLFDVKNFQRDEHFDGGEYTFQSIGSVAICYMIEGGEKLLDCCAAPGGKSVFLADKFSLVTACELHEHRAELIKKYADRMNRHNVSIVTCDSSVYNPAFDCGYDAVLCDCPCSGYGVVRDNPDIKLNRSEQSLSTLCETQLAILNNCARYVKPQGFLYYSTCSVFRIENDGTIQNFLSKNPDFKVVQANSALSCERTEYGLQFLPHISGGAGFYFCKMQRI